MLFSVAVMVEVAPGVTPVAKPPAEIVAPVVAFQVTVDVMFLVVWSAYVPVAVNCCVPLGATVLVAGVTAMETSGTAATVSVVVPTMPPDVAEMLLVPDMSIIFSRNRESSTPATLVKALILQ